MQFTHLGKFKTERKFCDNFNKVDIQATKLICTATYSKVKLMVFGPGALLNS